MQGAQQLSLDTLSASPGPHPVEEYPQALEAGVHEEHASIGHNSSSESEHSMRHHHRRASSAWRFGNGGGNGKEGEKEKERRSVDESGARMLSLVPLPTIETVMERAPEVEQRPVYRGEIQSDKSKVPQPTYKTVIHVPKPPNLRRRENLDAALLERVLREAARLRLDDERKRSRGGNEESENVDVAMYDCDEEERDGDTIDGSASSPALSFHTSASTWSSSTASSLSSSPSTFKGGNQSSTSSSSHPSPASSTLALPSTSPPSSPFLASIPPLSPPSSPSEHPKFQTFSSVTALDLGDALFDDWDDEMDWTWSTNSGEVVYGAAGLAVSPRVMEEGQENVCRHCLCGMDADLDMELYVIDEESGEEESERENGEE